MRTITVTGRPAWPIGLVTITAHVTDPGRTESTTGELTFSKRVLVSVHGFPPGWACSCSSPAAARRSGGTPAVRDVSGAAGPARRDAYLSEGRLRKASDGAPGRRPKSPGESVSPPAGRRRERGED
jgi:hypothetical protein